MSRHDVERLDALLSGEDDGEPSHGLANLVTLASSLRDLPVEEPADDFRLALRAELMTLPAVPAGVVERVRDRIDLATAGWRHSSRTAVAGTVASLLIGTTGVAAASQSALPGDLLYPIKSFTEDARMALAFGNVDEGRLHLAYARERLAEVAAGVDRLGPAQIADTLGEMDRESAAGAEQLLAAHLQEGVDGVLEELGAFTSEQRSAIEAVTRDLPLGAVAAAEQSLEVLRRIELQVDALLTTDCVVCNAVPDVAEAAVPIDLPRIVLPEDGPALPPPSCICVDNGTTPPGRPNEPAGPEPDPAGEPEPPAEPPVDEPQDPPVAEDSEPGTLDDVLDTLVDTLEETGEDLGIPVEDVTDVVDDVVEDLDLPTDEVTGLVDDLLSETGLDEPVGAVDDAIDGLLGP